MNKKNMCRVCGRPAPIGMQDCPACQVASERRAHPQRVTITPVYSGGSHAPTNLYRVSGQRVTYVWEVSRG